MKIALYDTYRLYFTPDEAHILMLGDPQTRFIVHEISKNVIKISKSANNGSSTLSFDKTYNRYVLTQTKYASLTNNYKHSKFGLTDIGDMPEPKKGHVSISLVDVFLNPLTIRAKKQKKTSTEQEVLFTTEDNVEILSPKATDEDDTTTEETYVKTTTTEETYVKMETLGDFIKSIEENFNDIDIAVHMMRFLNTICARNTGNFTLVMIDGKLALHIS